MNKVKVFLANEPTEFSRPLRSLINSQIDMEVVGEETGPVELLVLRGEYQSLGGADYKSRIKTGTGVSSHLLYEDPLLVVLDFAF